MEGLFCVRVGLDFLCLPIIYKVKKRQSSTDPMGDTRLAVFIKLMVYCGAGYSFVDAEHFASVTNSPQGQSGLVWDICMADGLLKANGAGFTLFDWMHDKGLLTPTTPLTVNAEPKPAILPQKPAQIAPRSVLEGEGVSVCPHAQKSDLGAKDAEKKASPAPIAMQQAPVFAETRNYKHAVRKNVFLSENEIDELKAKYSQEQIDKMLDLLSDYKIEKGRSYASDYAAINRWTAKRILDEEKAKEEKAKEDSEQIFPDWIVNRDKK